MIMVYSSDKLDFQYVLLYRAIGGKFMIALLFYQCRNVKVLYPLISIMDSTRSISLKLMNAKNEYSGKSYIL